MSEILHPKVQRLFFNKANIARPRSICLLSVVSCCSKTMAEYCGYLFWEFWYNVNDTVPTANFTLALHTAAFAFAPVKLSTFDCTWFPVSMNRLKCEREVVVFGCSSGLKSQGRFKENCKRPFMLESEKRSYPQTHTLMQTLHASTAYTAISCFMPVAQRSTITAPFRLPQSQ